MCFENRQNHLSICVRKNALQSIYELEEELKMEGLNNDGIRDFDVGMFWFCLANIDL